MVQEIDIWLERLSSLHKSQMRRAANNEGIQFVHAEILQYLSISNRYSNTAQALSEYLGQTKGSISQSLKFLEKGGYVKRQTCKDDKRCTRLFLTAKAKRAVNRISSYLAPSMSETGIDEAGMGETRAASDAVKSLLSSWQHKSGNQGFGLCESCRFHRTLDNSKFECGLTNEPLAAAEVKLICREHEFSNEF